MHTQNELQVLKIYILYNGCLRRALDVSRLAAYFRLNKCKIEYLPEQADYIIFVTCAFIKEKEKECISIIRRLNKYNRKLIVAGCLPGIASHKIMCGFNKLPVVIHKISQLDDIFYKFTIKLKDVPDATFIDSSFYLSKNKLKIYYPIIGQIFVLFRSVKRLINNARTSKRQYKSPRVYVRIFSKLQQVFNRSCYTRSAFLRIGGGCLGKCSYCAIRPVIGPLQSKPLEFCLQEYSNLIKSRYRHINIVSDDIGAYGVDLGISFAALLQGLSMCDPDKLCTWMLSHLHPRWAIMYAMDIMSAIQEGRVTSILSAIQSGSDRILRLMRRYGDSKQTEEVLLAFRKVNPRLQLSTNIIIGFPSETDEDVCMTVDSVKRIGFDCVWIFRYSDYEQNASYGLTNKISSKIVNKRVSFVKREFVKKNISFVVDDNIQYVKQMKIWREVKKFL